MSILKFNEYKVTNIQFKINNKFKYKQKIQISPNFSRKIYKVDSNHFVTELKVDISDLSDVIMPFHTKISIEGIFELEDWENQEKLTYVLNNASAILFPYLRTTLSSVTQISGLPTYTLPVINIAKYFENRSK